MTKRSIAFLVGNDQFSDKAFPPLLFCQNDVAGMARVLCDQTISEFEVIEVVNKRHDEVLERLEKTVNSLSPGDKFLFYFAGHGRRSPQSGRLYLVATDTKSDALRATGIPIESALDVIRESRCDNRALVLDCCYSGAVGEGFRGGDTASGLENLAEKNKGTYILTASTAIERAAEREGVDGGASGNGIFTKYFIEALQMGTATAADSDEITIDAVHDYIQSRVAKDAAQQPQRFVIGGAGRYVIGHSSASRWERRRGELRQRLNELLYQNIISDEQHSVALAICRMSWQRLTLAQKESARIGIDALDSKIALTEFLRRVELLAKPELADSSTGRITSSLDNGKDLTGDGAEREKTSGRKKYVIAAIVTVVLLISVIAVLRPVPPRPPTDSPTTIPSSRCRPVSFTDYSKNPPVTSTTTVCD
jgi:uncharacterized caspase-like protein